MIKLMMGLLLILLYLQGVSPSVAFALDGNKINGLWDFYFRGRGWGSYVRCNENPDRSFRCITEGVNWKSSQPDENVEEKKMKGHISGNELSGVFFRERYDSCPNSAVLNTSKMRNVRLSDDGAWLTGEYEYFFINNENCSRKFDEWTQFSYKRVPEDESVCQDITRDLSGYWKVDDADTIIKLFQKNTQVKTVRDLDHEESTKPTNISLEGKLKDRIFGGTIRMNFIYAYRKKCNEEWRAVSDYNYDSDNAVFLMDFTKTGITLTLSEDGNKLHGKYLRPSDENSCIVNPPVWENLELERVNLLIPTIDKIRIVSPNTPYFDLKEADIGKEFRVEVTVKEVQQPCSDSVSVDIRNSSAGKAVKVTADVSTSDPRIFLSKPIKIVSPENSVEEEGQ